MAIPFADKLDQIVKNFALFPSKKCSRAKGVRYIGLNIGKASIVGCEVTRQGDQYTLQRCGRVEVRAGEPLADQLKKFCDEIQFDSKDVNLSVKGQGVVIRFLLFPKMTREEFASSIQFEAEKYLPFNISEVALDYHINEQSSRANENSMEVILVAAKKAEIEKLVKTVEPAGLRVNAVDLDIFACVNAFEARIADIKDQVIGFVDFGAGDTTLCVLEKGVMAFSRDIAFGGHDLTALIRRKLNVSPEEADRIQREPKLPEGEQRAAIQVALDRLFQELKLSLNYFYSQHQQVNALSAFYVSGGFSQCTVLSELLESKLGVPIRRWDPTEKMSVASTLNREVVNSLVPYLPVSIGLALRPV